MMKFVGLVVTLNERAYQLAKPMHQLEDCRPEKFFALGSRSRLVCCTLLVSSDAVEMFSIPTVQD